MFPKLTILYSNFSRVTVFAVTLIKNHFQIEIFLSICWFVLQIFFQAKATVAFTLSLHYLLLHSLFFSASKKTQHLNTTPFVSSSSRFFQLRAIFCEKPQNPESHLKSQANHLTGTRSRRQNRGSLLVKLQQFRNRRQKTGQRCIFRLPSTSP